MLPSCWRGMICQIAQSKDERQNELLQRTRQSDRFLAPQCFRDYGPVKDVVFLKEPRNHS